MTKRVEQLIPHARKEGLVIRELPDEVLVYDLERHKAHCLNQTAALVWKNCNGQTTVPQIVERLESESALPIDEDIVWLALDRLDKARLLEARINRPSNKPGLSRRDAIRRIGIAAAVPLVLSVVAPTALAASSCVPAGQPCNNDAECCNNTPGNCNMGVCEL